MTVVKTLHKWFKEIFEHYIIESIFTEELCNCLAAWAFTIGHFVDKQDDNLAYISFCTYL